VRALSLAAVALGSLSGCSFLLVSGPPRNKQSGEIPCTVSHGWPVADGVMSATWVAEVGVAAFAVKDESVKTRAEIGGTFGAMAVAQALSAYYGAAQVARCREAQVEALNRGLGLQATVQQSMPALSPDEGRR
jgi:hypothetical protein